MKPEDFPNLTTGRVKQAPGGYRYFLPNPLTSSIIWKPDLVCALSAADRAVGELAGMGRNLPNPHLLISPFIRREAVLSSRIEGTRASLSDLYAYEAKQMLLWSSGEESDVREVVNYVRALEYGLNRLHDLPV